MHLKTELFDLESSLCCGQVFGWKRIGNWFYGFAGKPIKIRQKRHVLVWQGRASEKDVRHLFRLDDDLSKIYAAIARGKAMQNAIKRFRGLHLLRQDPWECSVSYICSANSSIPNTMRMLDSLRSEFGEETDFEGVRLYSFPKPESFAKAPLREIKGCGLGFRAPYVKAFAESVANEEIDFKALKRLPYEEAKAALIKQKGIGEKVADCILLFSLDRLEAFPVDVWIRRIMLHYYGKKIEAVARNPARVSDGDIRRFARRYFDGYAGYAQEYLFAMRSAFYQARQPNRRSNSTGKASSSGD